VYNETVSIQLLVQGTMRIKQWIVEGLLKLGFKHVYDKTKAWKDNDTSHQGWLTAPSGTKELVSENGVKFFVDIIDGQKTGFFLDQRDNRALLGHYAKGKNVLNTFSYTGGFSLYALANGAAQVHSVDSSRKAVDLGDENVRVNGLSEAAHTSYCQDVFEFLKNAPSQHYDIIVLDPPAFAKNAHAVPQASRAYKELNLKAFQKIKKGGLIFTFSCSQKIERDLFRKIVFGAAADAQRDVRILHQVTQSADHPVSIFHPEGEYLKGLVLQVE
jgi:23S rRNA (cytosine1962-C5)-methyltransferase